MSEYVIDSMVHNDLGAHERVDSGVLQAKRSFRPRQRKHRVLRAVHVAVFDQQRQDHIGREAQDESSARRQRRTLPSSLQASHHRRHAQARHQIRSRLLRR